MAKTDRVPKDHTESLKKLLKEDPKPRGKIKLGKPRTLKERAGSFTNE